ncbi:hypothetical protein [Ferroplasma acidiphilum]|uniref:Uncharacterized protein n=1 Tax=Ferroplasma acidiphilum TaxID=74969 RepID=A0A7K4FMP1_9ARCH|nr:hypothetical protein [Ferroplasma acidiphilum]NOL59347.1 hypothetical protein [Ferroplasma acidiphilum]
MPLIVKSIINLSQYMIESGMSLNDDIKPHDSGNHILTEYIIAAGEDHGI